MSRSAADPTNAVKLPRCVLDELTRRCLTTLTATFGVQQQTSGADQQHAGGDDHHLIGAGGVATSRARRERGSGA